MKNYIYPFSPLHFAEVMEHHYKCLLEKCTDAKRFNFISARHSEYTQIVNQLSN